MKAVITAMVIGGAPRLYAIIGDDHMLGGPRTNEGVAIICIARDTLQEVRMQIVEIEFRWRLSCFIIISIRLKIIFRSTNLSLSQPNSRLNDTFGAQILTSHQSKSFHIFVGLPTV